MSDLISREAVNDVIIWHETDGSIAARKALDRIAKLPTVPAIPIPENATNGDVIKALFNIKEVEMSHTYCVHFPEEEDFGHYFFKDWWNAPYKRGDTE